MFSDVDQWVHQRINQSSICEYPFPNLEIDGLFPQTYYASMMTNRIPDDCLQTLGELGRVGSGYSNSRRVLNLSTHMTILDEKIRSFWQNLAEWMNSSLKKYILDKFDIQEKRLHLDLLYTRDGEHYCLGPHTDSAKKVLTLLIYLPSTDHNQEYGTSIYTPVDTEFRCPGGPHHKRDRFNLLRTVPYTPNRAFAFLKTDNSFHGVEPVSKQIDRDLIIFDIQRIPT